ncbi:ABC transporter substrate-binding protein [Geminicoccus flavidas]|uniref:ABC transporter substrate-binding protein n=1 Tax=Geminicoccus flavidas TaxID=2506407 RepID=UPI00190F0E8E
MRRIVRPSRRQLLAGFAALPLARRAAAARAIPGRVATVDWALLETLLALDVVPVAAPELLLYRSTVIEPDLPDGIADIGLRGQPNYEALRATDPDLILSSNYYTWAEPALRRISPVESISIYGTGEPVFAAAEAATRQIGVLLDRQEAAERLVEAIVDRLAVLKTELAGGDGRPLIVINLGDARHFRVFGADSMFGEVLIRLGLANAWSENTSYSASAPLGIEMLAQVPDATIVVVPPVPPDAARVLPGSAFWNALPGVADGRLLRLDAINPFGALPAALRFARLLVDALARPPEERGLG